VVVSHDQGDKVQLEDTISHSESRCIFLELGSMHSHLHLQVHPYEEVAYDVYKLDFL